MLIEAQGDPTGKTLRKTAADASEALLKANASRPKGTCMRKNVVHTTVSLLMPIVFAASAYSQWVQTNWPAGDSFFSLCTSQGMIFARTWDSLNGGRVFLTADDGTNWTQISSADSDIDVLSVAVLNDGVLAGTWNGFYRSTLSDPNWYAFTTTGVPEDTAVYSVAMIGSTLFAGTEGHVYQSSVDEVGAWTEVGAGIPVHARITSIVASGNVVFAGSDSNGVFVATNGGTSWTAINSGLADTYISQLAPVDAKLFAVTLKGVFVYDARGASWAADDSGLKNVNCLLAADGLLFAGTDSDGVYLSADGGVTWTPFSSGMPAGTRVWSLAASSDNAFIFAGTGSGLWRAPLPATAVAAPTAPLTTFTETGG
jgi:hypothetical protein